MRSPVCARPRGFHDYGDPVQVTQLTPAPHAETIDTQPVPTRDAIAELHEKLRPYVRTTPVFTRNDFPTLGDTRVTFKYELLQASGTFKARGAFSNLLSLDEAQRAEAEAAIARARADHDRPVVTTIEGPATWYPAEDYHQEYWEGEGQRNPYCLAVIPPKLQKLRKSFADRVKA